MNPRIEYLSVKTLIGMHQTMSLVHNTTVNLWRTFKPRIQEIKQQVSTDLFSLQVYDDTYFDSFNPSNTFIKWAAIEVSSIESIPNEMGVFTIPNGLYAVFHFVGNHEQAASFFQEIFSVWLPHSSYQLDQRPHFERLGSAYQNGNPKSEEEVWIPIRLKSD